MPPSSSSFTALNVSEESIPEWMGSFSLSAPPNSDLWRKPPSSDTTTAPVLYTSLRNPFIAAEVTVSADWELEWDQGGLVIYAGMPPGHGGDIDAINDDSPQTTDTLPAYRPRMPVAKWVKVGLEFVNNTCNATSVVAGSDGADWSVTALPPQQARRNDLRIKFERIGYALWLYYEDDVLGWRKLREVTWFFWNVEDKSVRIGVYASRPANFGPTRYNQRHGSVGAGQRDLCVDFEGLEIF